MRKTIEDGISRKRFKIVFLIRSLAHGGAQSQLVVLARSLAEKGHSVSVAVLYSGGYYESELISGNVKLIDLKKRGRYDNLFALARLIISIKKEKPDILHSYMASPNVFACLAKMFCRNVSIVCGLPGALEIDPKSIASTGARIEAWVTRFSDLILTNSEAGKRAARWRGMPEDKIKVIENGIDSSRFRPDIAMRNALRKEWGIRDHELLIGLVGRLDPIKGHANFLRAAAHLIGQRNDVQFVCVGEGSPTYKKELCALSEELEIDRRVLWAGVREDMPHVYGALDVLCSASHSEGLPNVVCEAMACGTPCVVTDVGDCAKVVGVLGLVVPPGDAEALAIALDKLLSGVTTLDSHSLRQHIVSNYSITRLVARTEGALSGLVES